MGPQGPPGPRGNLTIISNSLILMDEKEIRC